MENQIIYKIYSLKALNEENLRYIGLTKQKLRERLSGHLNESKYRKTHKDNWIRKHNRQIEINLIEDNILGLDEANKREIYWIKYYRELGYKLVNTSDGGDGTLGVPMTDKHKKILSDLYTGKSLSEEHRKKIGDGRRGKKFTPEQKERHKLSKQNISEETKFKFKIAKYKTWLIKNGYIINGLNDLDVIKLRETIKLEKQQKTQEIYELNNLQTLEDVLNMIKTSKEETKLKKDQEIEEKKQLKELEKQQKKLKAEIRHKEVEERKLLKAQNLQTKINQGLIRVVVKEDGRVLYLPIMSDEQKLKNAEYNRTHKQSEETKRKIVESRKKYFEENPEKIRKLTQEEKEHLRKINTGKKYSEETKIKHSLHSRGNGNKCAKITEDDVYKIRLLHTQGVSRKELSTMFNMEYSTIAKIIKRTLWKYLE